MIQAQREMDGPFRTCRQRCGSTGQALGGGRPCRPGNVSTHAEAHGTSSRAVGPVSASHCPLPPTGDHSPLDL